MLRITAPEPVNGRVVGVTFTDGVAEVDGPLPRAVDLYLRTHGYRIEPAAGDAPLSAGEFVVRADAVRDYTLDAS